MLQARETIAQVNARALPWLEDQDRADACARLNAAAGVTAEPGSQWGSDVEAVSLDSFRAEIGAPPAPRTKKEG